MIIEQSNTKKFNYVKWIRRIGILALLLAIISTWYHVCAERNIYYLAERPFLAYCFVYSYTLAIFLWNVSFIAFAISLGIFFIEKQKRALEKRSDVTKDSDLGGNNKYLYLWWIPITANASLIYLNIIGYNHHRHVWGWPFIHTSCGLNPYGGPIYLDYFSYFWVVLDLFVATTIVLGSIFGVKYFRNRPFSFKQFSLEEILIFITAAAFLLPYAINEYRAFCIKLPEFPMIENYCFYYPLCCLMPHLQIPILLGVLCTAMVCGWGFVKVVSFAISKGLAIFGNGER